MSLLRVLIADDHSVVRRGLKALIETQPGWTVCGEASTGREAVELAKKFRPGIAVLDITMPELNGIEAARRILKVSQETEVLMLSAHYSEQLVRELIEAGIKGYVLKFETDRDLLVAIETIARHKPFFTSLSTQAVLPGGNIPEGVSEVVLDDHRLTSREREIAQMLSEGKSSKGIASVLGLSVKTIDTHRSNIMRKLKVHSVAELVRYAVRTLIIEP